MSARDVMLPVIEDHPREDTLADAILSALTAAGLVVEQDWQDIATAPRDGTRVLVYAQMPEYNQWTDPDRTMQPIQSMAAWHPDAGWCVCELREVTHWRPLPAPPAAQETQG